MAKTKTESKLSAVEHAEQTLRELEAKAAQLAEVGKADDAQVADIAFKGHTGDPQAAAKLETLTDRALRRGHELKSVNAAIQVAKEKVALALAEEAKTEQKRVALEVRGLVKSLRDAGTVCDEALATFTAGSDAMKQIIQRINALGFNHPSAMQYMSLGERAVRTALVQTAFARAFESIPPSERQHFNDFVGRWCVSLEREIAARLGENKQKVA